MIAIEEKAMQMDDLLDKMAEALQLDSTRRARMKSSYDAIKQWIEDDEKFFKPFKYDIYPHGSVRILTTVKPIGKDEFDLDIAIHLASNTPHTPTRIYQELKRRLEENDIYKAKIELKNRCIRLNYEGDYHMDILPGIQEYPFDINKLKVPDHELGHWVSSNPRGYADWFIGRANMVTQSLLEKALRAENLPTDQFHNKKPLQRAVQLIKRYRDLFFQKDDTYRTSSIILTTIAGEFYNGEESIFDAIDNIIITIRNKVNLSGARIKVLNPVNPAEDFTDKWDSEPNYYNEFKNFTAHLFKQWQELKAKHGVPAEATIFKGLFGESIFNEAFQNQAADLHQLRELKSLGANRKTGILSAASSAGGTLVKSNTFFGRYEDKI